MTAPMHLFIDDHYYDDDDDFDDNLNDCTIAPLAPAVLMDCGFEEVAFPESVTRKQIFRFKQRLGIRNV